jgi:hypothetical protein
MTSQDAYESVAPPPESQRPSRTERIVDSLALWQKLLVAFAGLIVAAGAVGAAVRNFDRPSPGYPPPTPVSSSAVPTAPTSPNASVLATGYLWKLVGAEAYSDASKTTKIDLTSMNQGQTAWLVVKALNVGSATWLNSGPYPVDLGTSQPRDRASRWATPAWLKPDRPATVKPPGVPPGEVGTFEFPIVVPVGSGTFDEHFNLVAEELTWFDDLGFFFHSVVH